MNAEQIEQGATAESQPSCIDKEREREREREGARVREREREWE